MNSRAVKEAARGQMCCPGYPALVVLHHESRSDDGVGGMSKKPRPDVKTLAGRTAAVHIPEQSTPVTVNPWDAEDDVEVQFHRHETDRSQPGADPDGFTMAPPLRTRESEAPRL